MKGTLLRDLSILWSLFHILVLFMLLYRSRYPRKKTFILTGIYMGPLIILNVAGLVWLGSERMGQLLMLTCTLPSLLFFWYISEDKKGKFFFTFGLADTVALWIIIVTNLCDFYFGGERYILMFLGRLVLFPLAEWYAIRYLRKPYLELQKNVSKGWGIFAVIVTVYYIILAVTPTFPVIITKRPKEMPLFLVVLISIPINYAIIFVALYRQLLLYRKQQSERIWQEQKAALEIQLENQQNIRKMKHDMKGHTVVLAGLLSAEKYDEAVAYLKNIESEMEIAQGQFCTNVYLNALFSHYSNKFQKLGIEMRLDIRIGDEELPYLKLCRILTNGLENAWDALSETEAEAGAVSVQMQYSKDYLIIRLKNRCSENLSVEKGTIPKSSKKGNEHGFGLLNVKETAESLNGEMLCYTEKGNFVLEVMVQVKNFRSLNGRGKYNEEILEEIPLVIEKKNILL